jgi:hypothetical protein
VFKQLLSGFVNFYGDLEFSLRTDDLYGSDVRFTMPLFLTPYFDNAINQKTVDIRGRSTPIHITNNGIYDNGHPTLDVTGIRLDFTRNSREEYVITVRFMSSRADYRGVIIPNGSDLIP